MKKIPKSYQIETARFVLRIPNEKDIPLVYSATRHKGFNDGMMWEPPETEEELIEPLKRNIKSWDAGEGYSFTIVKKETDKLLGRISIRKTADAQTWNVGFWTHPESQRTGIMTESLAAILVFGFEELSATKIEACHAIWNTASEKVLKKNGMEFVRYIEKGFEKHGKWVDENLLAIEIENWKNNHSF